MGAPNFYSKAGTVYAFQVEAENDEVQDVQQNIIADLGANPSLAICPDSGYDDCSRSYPGKVFACLTRRKSRNDLWAEAKLIIRDGYYGGANIDFALAIYDSYTGEYFMPGELDDDTIRESLDANYKRKPSKRQVAQIRRGLERDLEQLERELDKCLTRYTYPLRCVAVFSNGEAVYEPRQPA